MKTYWYSFLFFGLLSLSLAAMKLVLTLLRGFEWKDGILITSLLCFGVVNVLYSLSRKAFREEKLEEMDERNRFIKLKAQSRAYTVCQFAYLCGAVDFIVKTRHILCAGGLCPP